MKLHVEKRFIRTLLAASIAAIGTVPVAWAEEATDEVRQLITPDSVVEVGVVDVSRDSFKFGDYTGLEKRGTQANANVSIVRRNDEDARYLEIVGRNLGLDSRQLSVEGGQQGNFGVRIDYSELPKLYSDSYKSPYGGMGTSRLTAPAGWAGTIDTTPGGAINAPVAATVVTTAMMTQLAANQNPFEVKTLRKDMGLSLTKMLPAGWDVEVSYKHNKKEGTKLRGAVLQIAGGGSRGTMLVPDPIDYTTDRFGALARYSGEKLQVQIGYESSIFKNNGDPLVFDNLFYNAASSAGGNMLTGRLGQMPDNQFHQVNATAGYTVSKDTRLSGSVSLGRMTQNETFQPYITTTGILPATPVSSLNGKVYTTHYDFKLNTKLSQAVKLTAGYRYDDRDNRTPMNRYAYDPADNTNAAGNANAIPSQYVRINTPLSKTKQVLYADLDFHLSKATTAKLGFDYDKIKHTYEPTTGDKEATLKAEVKHRFSDIASGGLGYAHSNRKADAYNPIDALSATFTSTYLASLCVAPNTFVYSGAVVACTGAAAATGATTPWLDTPTLRKFFLTDRKRDKLRAFANVQPDERLDLQFGASYYNDDYSETQAGYGLTHATGKTFNFDASLRATEALTGNLFVTMDDFQTDQKGHNGSLNNLDRQLNGPGLQARSGIVSIGDRSWAMGLGVRYQPAGKFEWGGDITHVRSTGTTGFNSVGSAIAATVLPVPDLLTRRNRLDLFGKYKVQKDLTLTVNYAFERYRSADWAYDGQTLTSSTSFIGSGVVSPNYTVHMIGAYLAYKFQ